MEDLSIFKPTYIDVEWKTQKQIAEELSALLQDDVNTPRVRFDTNQIRGKGYGVLSGHKGMAKTTDMALRQKMAMNLLQRAAKIIAAAEGLIRTDQEELTPEEEAFWALLPEIKRATDEWTSEALEQFEPIELSSLL